MTRTQGEISFCFTHPLLYILLSSRYFDSEFTGESVELTPPDHKGGHLVQYPEGEEEGDDEYFTQFSYQGPGSWVLGGVWVTLYWKNIQKKSSKRIFYTTFSIVHIMQINIIINKIDEQITKI